MTHSSSPGRPIHGELPNRHISVALAQSNPAPPSRVRTYQGGTIPFSDLKTALTPINPKNTAAFQYRNNVNLSASAVAAGFVTLAKNYQLGQPLSADDLEFLRAYGNVNPIDSSGSASGSIAPASTTKFSTTTTQQGVKARVSGSLTSNIGVLINNSWSFNMTGAILSGRSNVTRNSVTATLTAYGAISKKPYVGKVYSGTYSYANGGKDVTLSRSTGYTGFIVMVSTGAYEVVNTKSGQFQVG